MPLLSVENLRAGYDRLEVVSEVTLNVNEGEIVALIGPNGAGKTTLLKTIAGLLSPMAGKITFDNESIGGLPAHIVYKKGLLLIPEGGRLFTKMSVIENLRLGALHLGEADFKENLRFVFQLFPVLEERQNQKAGTLSGGEQRMLAIARGLVRRPKLLMADELSLGLMPKLVTEILKALRDLNKQGLTLLLVEQYAKQVLELCHRGYVMERGNIVLEGAGNELLKDERVQRSYL
jgi:branched-chain amino acid transport system ATP-binding protein